MSLPKSIDHRRGSRPRRTVRRITLHQLYADAQPLAADITDQRVPSRQDAESIAQINTHHPGVFDLFLALDHIENRHADRGRHGVAAESIEIPGFGGELCHQFRLDDRAADRMPVTHRFSERNMSGSRPAR